MKNFTKGLLGFLNEAKTSYHAVDYIRRELKKIGFTELYENEDWTLTKGKGYFTVRNGSSVIAFVDNGTPFMVAAAHSDSPVFRVKATELGAAYAKLSTERYGGMINYTWLDRPLTVAGRVVVKKGASLVPTLADIGDMAVVIPSLAIHLDRAVNDGKKFNPAKDLLPLTSLEGKCVLDVVAEKLGVEKSDIVSHELFLVPDDGARTVGLSNELVLSPRIDDLASVYAALVGFLDAKNSGVSSPVLAVFDNEEVGSQTKQGAASDMLHDVLVRISGSDSEYMIRVSESFMASVDNAHAMHPNYPEMSDKGNAPVLGGGVVIKHNANQRYATDAVSSAIFGEICRSAGVDTQSYFNRADLPGGSTLGSISNTKVALSTVDIGVAQLAMHSAVETAAAKDVYAMSLALGELFSVGIRCSEGCFKFVK